MKSWSLQELKLGGQGEYANTSQTDNKNHPTPTVHLGSYSLLSYKTRLLCVL